MAFPQEVRDKALQRKRMRTSKIQKIEILNDAGEITFRPIFLEMAQLQAPGRADGITYAHVLVQNIWEAAMAGHKWASELVMERIDGKVAQVEPAGNGKARLTLVSELSRELESASMATQLPSASNSIAKQIIDVPSGAPPTPQIDARGDKESVSPDHTQSVQNVPSPPSDGQTMAPVNLVTPPAPVVSSNLESDQ